MMQVNDFTALKDELLSIDFIDINCNETERKFDFLLEHTITYANLLISNNDDIEKQREKFYLKIKARQKYKTETHFIRYLVVGNCNSNKNINCIRQYGGDRLKIDLEDKYNFKSDDIGQLKSLLKRLEKICIFSGTLLEYFKRDCQDLRDGKVWDDKQFNAEKWNDFMTYFGNGEIHKSIIHRNSRSSAIYNFGRYTHSSDKLLEDIQALFFQRKEVLALIIKELESADTSVESKKDDAPAPKAEEQGNNKPEPLNLTLIDIFEDISKYVHVMGLLVKKKNIQQHTFIWKDARKGHKSTIINILKNLCNKGYYKSKYAFVTNQFCIDIAKNTFNIEVKMSTAEKSKDSLDYIPYATAIS